MNALEIDQRTLSLAFPPFTLATLLTAVGAGILADGSWEFWARVVTPLWVGGPLQPAALVQSVFGFQNWPLAELIHLIVGVVFYPLGYLFVAKPIAGRFLPFLPWYLVALGYGVGLWVFALYIMAHVFAGLPPFLGFVPLAWASLIGHMVFGFVTGLVVRLKMG